MALPFFIPKGFLAAHCRHRLSRATDRAFDIGDAGAVADLHHIMALRAERVGEGGVAVGAHGHHDMVGSDALLLAVCIGEADAVLADRDAARAGEHGHAMFAQFRQQAHAAHQQQAAAELHGFADDRDFTAALHQEFG